MTRSLENPPQQVLHALETLERATAPAELGQAYQVLLDWRRKRPRETFIRNFAAIPIFLAVLAALSLAPRFFDLRITEDWLALGNGFLAASILFATSNWLRARLDPPFSVRTRIEIAVDRWRHAVPAMREPPR